MKVLSIGNSFSQDAHKWLHALAAREGVEIETLNLFIGGCSLEMHRDNLLQEKESYSYEPNGGAPTRKISIPDALRSEEWDCITLQQASPYSGMPETYEPYLSELVGYVRTQCPAAKLYFHKTWAYESGFSSPSFSAYGNDQAVMYARITKAVDSAARQHGLTVIPVGTVIQTLRTEVPAFDYAKTGLSLCRDGYHLSLDYGRFAAAATWFTTLTGRPVSEGDFENFDLSLLGKIVEVVNRVCGVK